MCNATMWYNERSDKSRKAVTLTFSLCCQEGKLLLPRFSDTPQPLKKLLDYNDPTTLRFKDQIRVYNSMFCFTSFGARIDHSFNSGRGPYTFRINGQSYHRMCSLLPVKGVPPRYAQLYFYDTQNEIRNRMSAFMSKGTPETVDKNIVANLIQMLNQTSAMAKSFRMAKEWCHSHGDVNFGLRLLSERTSIRQYNAPTIFEVSALIINDFRDVLPTRDIVVNKNNTGPQRILELHPSYMALQYPLLFPFGEDGYHENIPYHINEGIRKTKRGYVTMKEYYAYIIQQRQNQGTTLLRGGTLFQQYLVVAFTANEEQRLNWIRNNQDTLRVDLYHNLCDVVTRGDTSAAGLGNRIVLPWTYIGSPRYMMHNYQDAMDLCRTYGNPDLFITFTSNPKWPEIAEMLAYILGQKSHNRSEVGTRVFKMKLIELLEDLTKHHIFGKSCVGLDRATIAIQKNVKAGDNGASGQIMTTQLRGRELDFKDLPQPNPKLLTNLDKRLLREALAVDANKRQFCFIHGPGGTGKTFLYNTIIARLRSEQMIVLVVASLGIASLLLPAGRTAHSRFIIPLELMENSTCALDKTLREILGYKNPAKRNRIFGGMTILLGGDFRQILPVIPNAKRLEIFAKMYPDFTSRQTDDDYLKERVILTPKNDDADAINENMFKILGGALLHTIVQMKSVKHP
ncbi:helicase [Tanacetum coccineum]